MDLVGKTLRAYLSQGATLYIDEENAQVLAVDGPKKDSGKYTGPCSRWIRKR